MSTTFTITDLRGLLISAAGAEESVDMHDDILDTPFVDLGYDSLALMETATRICHQLGIELHDDDVATAYTPRALIDMVNAA